MEINLYCEIKRLVDRKYEIKKLAGIIKYEMKHDVAKKDEFKKLADEYEKIERTLDYIRKNCFISPLIVAKIITKKEGTPYTLKIFREIGEHNGHKFYTGNFIACYINEQNKYFNYDVDGVCYGNLCGDPKEKYINYPLPSKEFNEVVGSLEKTKAYLLATSKEQSFVPTLATGSYLEGINFIDLLIYGHVSDFICDNFQRSIKSVVKQYLEAIDAEKFLCEFKKDEKQRDNT